MATVYTGTELIANDYNLAGIRKRFVEMVQAYHLVESGDLTANVDAGANKYINEGLRYLDLQLDLPQYHLRRVVTLTVGSYFFRVRDLITPYSISLHSSLGIVNLTPNQYSWQDFLDYYGPVSSWSTGVPGGWTWAPTHLCPEQRMTRVVLDGIEGYEATAEHYDPLSVGVEGVLLDDSYDLATVMFAPKVDVACTAQLIGHFHSPRLERDGDRNWLSSKYPELLALAASYCFERSNRSSSGMDSWLKAMGPLVVELQKTGVTHSFPQQTITIKG